NLHVAAQRHDADSVFDSVPGLLRECGREPDVEAARAHPDPDRSEEVPRLVDEDQERQAEDGDEDVHAVLLASRGRSPVVAAVIGTTRAPSASPSRAFWLRRLSRSALRG